MMKYPIGIQSFDQIIEDGYVYIDKTDLIYQLVKGGKIYFLSRPRRFGKSLLVSTLKCYFQGRKELFKGLAIDRLETEWAEYPVFHIDFNGTDFTRSGKLDDIIGGTVGTWEKEYGRTTEFEDIGKRFAYVLQQAHKRYGRRCVVLVDEYDKPILDVLDTGYTATIDGKERLLEDIHREILKSFYSTFKLADEDLQFVLLTGVTKFSQVSVFSGFNQPSDISMDEQYETLCGITQEELERYFAEPIKALAVKYKVTEEGMLDMLKHRYDGYHFSGNLTDIYNPFSLLNAFAKKALRDYWFSSGTPTYLVRLLNHTQEDLNGMTGKYYEDKEFVDYKADVEKPLPMIYQSGYLTIKGYDSDFGTFLLDFPNNEVKSGFVSLVEERLCIVGCFQLFAASGKPGRLDTECGCFHASRRFGTTPQAVYFFSRQYPILNACQEGRGGKGTLLPLYALPHLPPDKRLHGLYGERTEPGACRLHRGDG